MPDEAPPKKTPRTPKTPKAADEAAGATKEKAPTAETPATPSEKSSPPAEAPAKTSAAPKAAKPSKPAGAGGPKKSAPPKPAAPAPPPVEAEKPTDLASLPPTATVVDASGLVLGRAASLIAKRLLNGETVVVVNAEKSVVVGNRKMVVDEYIASRAQGSVRSGPHFPRYPDRIFRRTVRGMLPHLKTRGKVAFDRLHVYIGVPAGLSDRPKTALDGARARPALRPPTTLQEITRLLGARV